MHDVTSPFGTVALPIAANTWNWLPVGMGRVINPLAPKAEVVKVSVFG